MRIDAYNKVSQVYQSNNMTKVQKTEKVRKTDQVEISQVGRDFAIAKQAVAASADIRMDKVNALKEQFSSNTYQVSGEELADKLIERYFDQSI